MASLQLHCNYVVTGNATRMQQISEWIIVIILPVCQLPVLLAICLYWCPWMVESLSCSLNHQLLGKYCFSDQHLISPYNINTLSSRQVMRIKEIVNILVMVKFILGPLNIREHYGNSRKSQIHLILKVIKWTWFLSYVGCIHACQCANKMCLCCRLRACLPSCLPSGKCIEKISRPQNILVCIYLSVGYSNYFE